MICGATVEKSDVPARHPGSWARKAVVDAHFETANVEIIEVAVESSVAIFRAEMLVSLRAEALSEEVSNVTECDEDEVAEVGGDEEVVRG